MIEPILKELEALVNAEFNRIIEEYGYFHSRHEALAVSEEEIEELKNEVKSICMRMVVIKYSVFHDIYAGLEHELETIELRAKLAAAEAIQVAAVARKFRLLLDHEKLGDKDDC